MTTYKEQYIREMDQMDGNANVLTKEEKNMMKEEYRIAKLDMSEEEALYYIAIDFNVIVTVVRQIVEKP